MYWVVVTTALTRFAKKVGLSYSLLFSIGHCANREHPVMLVTCQPPIGWAIGTMTAWTLGLSCRSLFACVTSSCDLFAPWVASACAVARDWPCDCSVACGPLCPNTYCWLLTLQYVCYILNHISTGSLGGQVPLQVLYGVTPDISIMLLYTFYQP